MRILGTFMAGFGFAVVVMVITAPLWLLAAGTTLWSLRDTMFSALEGESVFGLRERDGHLEGRVINVGFHAAQVLVPDDPRPRRILLRLEVVDADVFSAEAGEGRVRLDAWRLDRPADLKQPPLYTIVAPGRGASLPDDGTLVVDRGQRRSVYSLSAGAWLFDADSPVTSFNADGDRRRFIAVSVAEDDLPPTSLAVLTYASPQAALRRLLVATNDPSLAKLMRSAIPVVRPVVRTEGNATRVVDLALPAGTIQIPMAGDDLDLTRMRTPPGIVVTEFKPWGIR